MINYFESKADVFQYAIDYVQANIILKSEFKL